MLNEYNKKRKNKRTILTVCLGVGGSMLIGGCFGPSDNEVRYSICREFLEAPRAEVRKTGHFSYAHEDYSACAKLAPWDEEETDEESNHGVNNSDADEDDD